jgi:hypothetical protein
VYIKNTLYFTNIHFLKEENEYFAQIALDGKGKKSINSIRETDIY